MCGVRAGAGQRESSASEVSEWKMQLGALKDQRQQDSRRNEVLEGLNIII